MSSDVRSFRDLVAWRKAFALCLRVYRVCEVLPRDERFGLVQELRKTARSVVCNIAEGQRRGGPVEFKRFLDIARGSAGELCTQVLLCQGLGYLKDDLVDSLVSDIEEINRISAGIKRRLSAR